MDALETRTIFWFTVHTTPNHNPLKMDFPPETFLQSNLAAKWLVRHSITSPKQQPSLLADYSSVQLWHSIRTTLDQDIYCNLK